MESVIQQVVGLGQTLMRTLCAIFILMILMGGTAFAADKPNYAVELCDTSGNCPSFAGGIVPTASSAPNANVTQVSCIGAAAASLTCALPAVSAKTNYLRGFRVNCGKSSGTTSEGVITVTGLSGTSNPTYYIDESQTQVSFVWDSTFGDVPASAPNTAITVNVPAITNGGPCAVTLAGPVQ